MPTADAPSLSGFLKRHRAKLDPASLGYSSLRRRTPGLRREEVALRANVSTTWYTWLEQGRGGAPSTAVLERIAQALMLTDAEREHLFLLAFGHPPKARYQPPDSVTPRLQRVIDALQYSPAIVTTATWDVIAWNRAATVILTDYALLPVEQRNVLRLIFGSPRARQIQDDWEAMARHVVAAFRANIARAGASREVESLIDELSLNSPEFKAMWSEQDVHTDGGGTKHLRHPDFGTLTLEYSAFAVEGRPDLSLTIYNPATPGDVQRVAELLEQQGSETAHHDSR